MLGAEAQSKIARGALLPGSAPRMAGGVLPSGTGGQLPEWSKLWVTLQLEVDAMKNAA